MTERSTDITAEEARLLALSHEKENIETKTKARGREVKAAMVTAMRKIRAESGDLGRFAYQFEVINELFDEIRVKLLSLGFALYKLGPEAENQANQSTVIVPASNGSPGRHGRPEAGEDSSNGSPARHGRRGAEEDPSSSTRKDEKKKRKRKRKRNEDSTLSN